MEDFGDSQRGADSCGSNDETTPGTVSRDGQQGFSRRRGREGRAVGVSARPVLQKVRDRVASAAVENVCDKQNEAGASVAQAKSSSAPTVEPQKEVGIPQVRTPPVPKRSTRTNVREGATMRGQGDALLSEPPEPPKPFTAEARGTASVHVIDILDSDEEVRMAKSQSRRNNPLKAPEVDLTKFEMIFVEVDVKNIIEPPQKVRCVEQSHVKMMERKLNDDGYIGSAGAISIALKDAASLTPEGVAEMIRKKTIHVEVFLVDGRHRLIAIRRLALRFGRWAEEAKMLRVGLWIPKDDSVRCCLSFTEILNLGAYLNNTSSTNKAMTFQDRIYACVSLAKLLDKSEGVDIQAATSSALASALCVGKTLGDQKMRQLQRYAQVALKLAQNDALFKVFIEETKEDGKLMLTHMTSDVLLGFEVEAFRLGLRCVRARLGALNSERDVKVSGKFEQMAREFYTRVGLMYQEVKKAARFSKKSVSLIMKKSIVLTGDDTLSVSENICAVMSRFRGVNECTDRRMLNNLKKRLKDIVGDYEAEQVDEGNSGDEDRGQSSPNRRRGDRGSGKNGEGSDCSGTYSAGETTTARAPEHPSSPAPVPRKPSLRSKGRIVQPTPPVSTPSRTARRTPRSKRATPSSRRRKRSDNESDSEYGEPKRPAKKRKADGKGTGDDGRGMELVCQLRRMSHQDIVRAMDAVNLDVVPRDEEMGDGGEDWEDPLDDPMGDNDQSFDDTIPTELPVGYCDPNPYEGPENPEWCDAVHRLPSQWPEENPIVHPQPFLEALFVPHEHRGNIFIQDAEVLKQNHHMVFFRAAHNYFRAHKEELTVARKGAPSGDVSEKLAMWGLAISADYMAKVYFAGKRQELETEGYCILENFLHDDDVPESMIAPVGEDKDMFSKLRNYVSSSFPGARALRDTNNREIWNWIVNDGRREVDDRNGEKGIGRYITSNKAVTTDVEGSPDRCWVGVSRAFLDLRIVQVMSAVVPWDNTNPAHEKMFIPKTGGRWLLTWKNCQRQNLHTDFPTMSRTHVVRGTKNPGYFTVATGDMEVPLWVCPYSHKTVAMASENSIRALSRCSIAGRVRIPRYSIFAGRGDVFHGGAAARDLFSRDGGLRYHLYFVPQSHTLPNAVHMMSKFQPLFRKNLEDSSDEDGDDDSEETISSEDEEIARVLEDERGDMDSADDIEDAGETAGDAVVLRKGRGVIAGTQESERRKRARVATNADIASVPDTAEQEGDENEDTGPAKMIADYREE